MSEKRVARMTREKLAGAFLAQHVGGQNCQDVAGKIGRATARSSSRSPTSCEYLSGETGQTTSRAASRSPGLQECLGQNGQTTSGQGISERRRARVTLANRASALELRGCLDEAKLAGPPRAWHAFQGLATSRAASRKPDLQGCILRNWPGHLKLGRNYLSSGLRGCTRRNGPDTLARGICEPRDARTHQAERTGPPRAPRLLLELRDYLR